MESDSFTHFIAIGACYIDTILTVPAYPVEDAKQRASATSKRRGGNCPNTLEVLQQLYPLKDQQAASHNDHEVSQSQHGHQSSSSSPELILLSALPSSTSPDTKFIIDSFDSSPSESSLQLLSRVGLSHTFYREAVTTAASSYIVQSQKTHSRTIVNYNALDEMTLSEFQNAVTSLLLHDDDDDDDQSAPTHKQRQGERKKKAWFHFEGRIPETILQCIVWLRASFSEDNKPAITISVECEKPLREGLETLAEYADVVFYSRSWAEGKGYSSAAECLVSEAARISSPVGPASAEHESRRADAKTMVLCCTWGEAGASMLEFDRSPVLHPLNKESFVEQVVTRPAWRPDIGELEVVDTIGAGDTWIAGILFGLMSRSGWSEEKKVEFANELAGRKIQRDGFAELGREMKSAIEV